ncbi:mucoidy inhibitor MuiA family protein [Formosa algae]|uniref:mucoidy inhibitor MuiA family protein n=1 Tax=Formosa algae TaxID=225843 RepID=UPI000CD2B3FD|nr:mucoidy inhibitor MuiA family protein [Formosa algae]
MKHIILFTFCLIFSTTYAQIINEKKITSEVSEVTVFIKDAQITRKKTIDLQQGITILKFINLSPFIDAKSIQVKANGNLTVLSVNHQQNYIDKLDKQQEVLDLELKSEDLASKINLEKTYLDILKEELAFLQENRTIGGKNQELSVTNLKEVSNFYGTKLTALKLKEIDIIKKLETLNNSKSDIDLQIKTLTSQKEFPNGEILVKIDSKNYNKADFELSYLVGNSSWFPSYDIRAKTINEPIEIIYKANVKQDTKVDWTNVKLNLSSANPNNSGVAPELKTYYLNYNTLPPTYNLTSNEITGKVLDEQGLPLPGVNVLVEGTTIGTSTDFDGNYSITIPNYSSQLTFSYIGYINQTSAIRQSPLNIQLQEDVTALDEVVVVGYGTSSKKRKSVNEALSGSVSGISIRGASSTPIPANQVVKQTTVDFAIDIPYSVKSDNKSYTVDMANYQLPADYNYICVPKIEKDAFLIAEVSDWEKYNLLEGEANLFFEDTYVGKTLLDTRYASDTLKISLGRDKNVSVKREKVKDFTTKQFIGSKKEDNRAWTILVKNNKNQTINMSIFDQVPVSTLEEIKVDITEMTKAEHDKDTGEITWDFSINPKETKTLNLNYSIKYPKNKNLVIE